MTVEELIEELKQFDPDMRVVLTYNYGDYWNTMVAPEVKAAEVGNVTPSAYHRMDKLSSEREEEEGDFREVVILSS